MRDLEDICYSTLESRLVIDPNRNNRSVASSNKSIRRTHRYAVRTIRLIFESMRPH